MKNTYIKKIDNIYYLFEKHIFFDKLLFKTKYLKEAIKIQKSNIINGISKHSAFTYCQDQEINNIYKSCFETIEIKSL